MQVTDSISSKILAAVARRLLFVPSAAAGIVALGREHCLYASLIVVYFANTVVVLGLNYGLAVLATVAMHQFRHVLRLFRASEIS
jgi:hypothetical protein